MTNTYLVLLDDITPNRATVVSVRRYDSEDVALEMADGAFAIVTDDAPEKGERVWIYREGPGARYTITGRQ